MNTKKQFDVIVIGGGHAGTEAALAAARMGAKTLLITHNIETLGQMSCNPAIGGIGKGHLVKEVDAMGGAMASAADKAGIHFRTLNARKGPAVRATRAQADRALYKQSIRKMLEHQPNLSLFQQAVEDLIVKNNKVTGVVTQMGLRFTANAVVLTVGTFLGGKIHIGLKNYQGGRAGDPPSIALANRLREMPFRVERLKTGTPPRIDGRTIDYTKLEEQPGDTPVPVFSYMGHAEEHPTQISCYITHTNEKAHDIIKGSLDSSPIYSGVIESVGPRYCPSIEDKVVRFADRNSHQIFIEPEGLNTTEIYPNGISTSLPYEVQVKFVQQIKGFEKAHITRPGYAIEYDYFDPRDLKSSLETKHIAGLFFAGQINGTTGYEEAGAQGLIAGINATLLIRNKAPWSPKRHEAYIGVLIDDLITCGTLEPYRMFTSRAEHRLILREDNADLRLTTKARELGLINDERWRSFEEKREAIEKETERLNNIWIDQHRALELLRRPEITYKKLMERKNIGPGVKDPKVAEQVEVQTKYAGYIDRQQQEIERDRRQEDTTLPKDLDIDQIIGLSNEARQKLKETKPTTIGQMSRIPGITPAAVSLMLVHLKKQKMKAAA